MNNKSYDKKKITKFLFDNGVNVSSRTPSFPKDNEIISLNKVIDSINFGADILRSQWSIRVRFVGCKSWYDIPISNDKVDYWLDIIKFMSQKEEYEFSEDNNDSEWDLK
jgi:hypothetical protein